MKWLLSSSPIASLDRSWWLFVACLLLGAVAHGGWLAWQPLWADEGYSIYFATEPLARMVALTAQDIHPPLYYALLHLWLATLGGISPILLRIFSVIVALPALLLLAMLTRLLFPTRSRLLWIATLLFLVNPLYLFYSQEVRMYGLALTLSLAATYAFWHLLNGVTSMTTVRRTGFVGWSLFYIVTATAALYTLYYTAFLLLAHLLWALYQHWTYQRWTLRETMHPRTLIGQLCLIYFAILLLYAPWLYYVARDLTTYVVDKVGADQDQPLALGTYLLRHLYAFVAGHLSLPRWPFWWRTTGAWIVGAVLLVGWGRAWVLQRRRSPNGNGDKVAIGYNVAARSLLWSCLVVPTAIAFGVNRFFPFFPDGGERLLLFVLPYFLLLVALAVDALWSQWHLGKLALAGLSAVAIAGIVTFYTLPRHQADDYRPLIRHTIQQSTNRDTWLATFPWQVGLWRVYAPLVGLPTTDVFHIDPRYGPDVRLISERSVRWGPEVTTAIDEALAQGRLWYPGLRSIGSTLPAAIDHYLEGDTVPLVDVWYGNTTLRAWQRLDPAQNNLPVANGQFDLRPVGFTETLMLESAAVTVRNITAANEALRIDLGWAATSALSTTKTAELGMTLRLYRDGYYWAGRDVEKLVATTGLIVPAGLPPDTYSLRLGVTTPAGELVSPVGASTAEAELITLAEIAVIAPTEPLLAARLPIAHRLDKPSTLDGVTLLGYSGGDEVVLAGEALSVTLFWQANNAPPEERQIYLSLLAEDGQGVAGWEGWPLPDYPLSLWPTGALVQTPVTIVIPATVEPGRYRLGGGLLDPATAEKSPFVLLGEQEVHQRAATFTPTAPPTVFTEPQQIGSHAWLRGYELMRADGQLSLRLYWEALQPLYPPHHIFVHLDNATGVTVAQDDGLPMTAAGPAPTGSWRAGEYLITEHQLMVPTLDERAEYQIQVGLYLPATGARLPVSSAGSGSNIVTGDTVTIPLSMADSR